MYSPHKGTASKKMQLQLKDAGLDEVFTFFSCIREYARTAIQSYGLLRDSDSHYLNSLHLIRLLVDAIGNVYGLSLANNPTIYIERFLANKPTNNLKSGNTNLTATYVINKADELYTGLATAYKESNNYLHPSIYFRLDRGTLDDTSGILCKNSIWKSNLPKKDKLNSILDFYVTTLRNILYYVQLEVFNTALVPHYPQLQHINYSTDNINLELTFKSYKVFVEQWRLEHNVGWQHIRIKKTDTDGAE